jgi:hypothetical protein
MVAAALVALTAYQSYTNARFGFTVRHPTSLRAQPPPENGDGREWRGEQGRVRLAAFGVNNVEHLTPRRQARADARGLHVVYRHIAGKVVTVSGTTHGGRVIVYHRDVVGRGSIDSLQWTYPAREKKRWDAAVTKSALSFRPGDVSRSH